MAKSIFLIKNPTKYEDGTYSAIDIQCFEVVEETNRIITFREVTLELSEPVITSCGISSNYVEWEKGYQTVIGYHYSNEYQVFRNWKNSKRYIESNYEIFDIENAKIRYGNSR